MEAELSTIFGEQVMSGLWNAAAPTLVGEAVDVSQAGMTTPHLAMAAVEDGLADTWRGSMGMIHVPPGILSEIVQGLDYSEGRFHTATGHIVVGDAGYQGGTPGSGSRPVASSGSTAPRRSISAI